MMRWVSLIFFFNVDAPAWFNWCLCDWQEGEEEADEENDPDYEPKVGQTSVTVSQSVWCWRHTEHMLSPPLMRLCLFLF